MTNKKLEDIFMSYLEKIPLNQMVLYASWEAMNGEDE